MLKKVFYNYIVRDDVKLHMILESQIQILTLRWNVSSVCSQLNFLSFEVHSVFTASVLLKAVSWSFSLLCSSVRKADARCPRGRLCAVCGGWCVTCDQERRYVKLSNPIIARRVEACLHMIYSSENVLLNLYKSTGYKILWFQSSAGLDQHDSQSHLT